MSLSKEGELFVNGSAGIGIENPNAKLHINSTEFVVARFETTENEGAIYLNDKNAGFSCWTVYGDITALGDTCGIGSSNLIIRGDGDVGMGILNPQNKLNVEGKVNATTGFITGAYTGISDSSSYWLCTSNDCSTTCQVNIQGGIIVGCT